MSGIVVAIGYVLLIPSVLGVLFSVLLLFTASTVGRGSAIAGGAAVFFGIVSLVGGLLGWILIMKKNILQCDHCGAVIAAS